MKISDQHLAAIQTLGYTPDEARFLYIVATYSGYFVPRQFLAFTGSKGGKRSSHFTEKLESRGHVTWREFERVGVYHLFSKTLYRQIDREDLRNCRRHSTEFVRTRLLVLDFVLANQCYDYLETEQQKVRHFCDQLRVSRDALPSKMYRHITRTEPTLRYFVDGFPLFLDPGHCAEQPILTFSFVDPGLASLAAFTHHLRAYGRLFGQLPGFRYIYISDSPVHFVPAADAFSALVTAPPEPSDLVRYFRVRREWEGHRYTALTHDDLEALNQGRQRFPDSVFNDLYARWLAADMPAEAVRDRLTHERPLPNAHFQTWLATARFHSSAQRTGFGQKE